MPELITLEGLFLDALPMMLFSAVYVAVTLAIKRREWLPEISEGLRRKKNG
jgi:hypothetical protein